jgi:hypothetical protein
LSEAGNSKLETGKRQLGTGSWKIDAGNWKPEIRKQVGGFGISSLRSLGLLLMRKSG